MHNRGRSLFQKSKVKTVKSSKPFFELFFFFLSFVMTLEMSGAEAEELALRFAGNFSRLQSIPASAILSARRRDGRSCLHIASEKAEPAAVKYLLSLGLDPSKADGAGLTPLHLACSATSLETVELLLDSGADPSARTFNGVTPLSLLTGHQTGGSAGFCSCSVKAIHRMLAGEGRDDPDFQLVAPIVYAIQRALDKKKIPVIVLTGTQYYHFRSSSHTRISQHASSQI